MLPTLPSDLSRVRVVAGFDAFVDEALRVVAARGDSGPVPMGSLRDFAAVAAAAAGGNALREVLPAGRFPGGCSVNLGAQLAALGAGVELFATTGGDPVFDLGFHRVQPLDVAPGHTLCMEFDDGKLMLSSVSHLSGLTPERLEPHRAAMVAALRQAQGVALTNWSLFPAMTECWRWFARRCLAGGPRLPLLVDLVDPSARSPADLAGLVEVLRALDAVAEVHLSLNRTEAGVLARHLGVAPAAAALRHALAIHAVVLHNRQGNAVAELHDGRERLCERPPGPLCANPVRSTGAGDRFNAGYLLGRVLGLEAAARLDVGSAVSGAFLRRGTSPDRAAVAALLRDPAWPA